MQKLPINPFLDFYSTPDAMIINPFVFAGGAFDPLSLSPALWLSDTGSDSSTWPDLSGNNRDASQATAGSRPAIITGELNGRQVRRFDGSNDGLSGALNTASLASFSIFAVHKNTTSATQCIFHNGDSGANGVGFFEYLGNRTILKGGVAFASDGAFADNTWEIWCGQRNSGTTTLHVNGSTQSITNSGNSPINPSVNYYVGIDAAGTSMLAGDIAEILVFPTALGTTDRQNVENYLNAKYAIY